LKARSIEPEIAKVRLLHRIVSPGALEGGDVLRIGKTFYVGISGRTNLEGMRQFGTVGHYGYKTIRSAGEWMPSFEDRRDLACRGRIDCERAVDRSFALYWFEILRLSPDEPWGANALALNGSVLMAHSSPRTADLLESKGLEVKRVNISELPKSGSRLDVPQRPLFPHAAS